jgi:hypothetical protein
MGVTAAQTLLPAIIGNTANVATPPATRPLAIIARCLPSPNLYKPGVARHLGAAR